MVENHLRGFVDIGHHTEDETGLFLQGVHPGIDILGIVVEDAFVKAHRIADHGSGQLCNELFLGIFLITEMAFHVSSKAFLHTCRMGHLMGDGAVVLHTVLKNFLGGVVDFELFLHRNGDFVFCRTVESASTFDIVDLADPCLLVNHLVELLGGVHTGGILDMRCLELILQLGILLRLDLREVGLLQVPDIIAHHNGDGLDFLLLCLGHGFVGFIRNLLTVLILMGDVPVDDRHGLLTLGDSGSSFLYLLIGGIDGYVIAVGSGMQLEEEVIMS